MNILKRSYEAFIDACINVKQNLRIFWVLLVLVIVLVFDSSGQFWGVVKLIVICLTGITMLTLLLIPFVRDTTPLVDVVKAYMKALLLITKVSKP